RPAYPPSIWSRMFAASSKAARKITPAIPDICKGSENLASHRPRNRGPLGRTPQVDDALRECPDVSGGFLSRAHVRGLSRVPRFHSRQRLSRLSQKRPADHPDNRSGEGVGPARGARMNFGNFFAELKR